MLANQSTGGNYTPVPEGQHFAYCFAVIGLGKQKAEFQGKEKIQPKARLMFVLPTLLEVFDEARGPEPRIISRSYTLSLDDRATLFKDLKTWRAKGITEAEKSTYDLCERLNKPATLTIIHKVGVDGKIHANIEAINPGHFVIDANGKAGAIPSNPMASVEYDISMGKNSVFLKLPKYVQEAILKSEEFTAPAKPAAPFTPGGNPPVAKTAETPVGADDVPF